MFNFSKQEKITLLVLSFILLIGLGFSFHRTNSRQINPAIKSVYLEKIDLESIDKIIQDYSVININTATADELERLPGIGPTLAKRIITYRKTKGFFTDKKDLLKIKGIGPKLYGRIEESVSIE
jgi:competence protein ComEA